MWSVFVNVATAVNMSEATDLQGILVPPKLFNWRCPACKDWRGIGGMNEAKQCRECGTKCEWVEYRVCLCGCSDAR